MEKKMDQLLKDVIEYSNRPLKYLNLPFGLVEWINTPEKEIKVSIPIETDDGKTKIFTGYRVQDKNVFGPFKGGMRYAPDVSLEKFVGLAKGMTKKCRVHDLPLGGGKGGIRIDTKKHSVGELRRATKRLIAELKPNIGPEEDILAPDMYTNEQTMLWMVDAYIMLTGKHDIGVVTGKPIRYGGIVGRNTATGMGCYYIIQRTAKNLEINIPNSRIIIDGCGNAAIPLIKRLSEVGARIVGISDSKGGIHNPKGLNTKRLLETKKNDGSVIYFKEGDATTGEEILEVDCDILILAAKENRIKESNADKIRARYIFEPANDPTTPKAHDILCNRGVYISPDILDSGGGVTVSWFEMCQNAQLYPWTCEQVNTALKTNMIRAYERVRRTAAEYKLGNDMRLASHILSTKELAEAAIERGFWP